MLDPDLPSSLEFTSSDFVAPGNAGEGVGAMQLLQPYDRDSLRDQFRSAEPFPFVEVTPFLEEKFAGECIASLPGFAESRQLGREFSAVNERKKVQITDPRRFPAPIAALNDLLQSEEWLADLEYITGIKGLLADPELVGGGIHVTGPRGRLDVHVDFNYVEGRDLHRRLNILIYFNDDWKPEWGGAIELWDKDVTQCRHSFLPSLNRCVLFETSEISFHGVSPVTCPADRARKSFAAYYYTREAPTGWDGQMHTTLFRARPTEKWRSAILLPAQSARLAARRGVGRALRFARRLLRR